MEHKYNIPNNVMFVFDPHKIKDPMKCKTFGAQKTKMIKGVVESGLFKVSPGASWNIDNPSPGVFNIYHPFGHAGINFSMGLYEDDVGSINVVTLDDTHIEVNTRDSDGNLMNKNFVFSLSLVTMAQS